MVFRFDAILYSKFSNENSDVGHVKYSRGPKVPHPCFRGFGGLSSIPGTKTMVKILQIN